MAHLTLGEQIHVRRRRLGLSQRALAERLGLKPSTISMWETNASVPSVEMLVRVARILETSPNELTSFEEAGINDLDRRPQNVYSPEKCGIGPDLGEVAAAAC